MHDETDDTIVVGDLTSAKLGERLVCVGADTSFEEIETLMLLHDYSQIPVIHNRRRHAAVVQRAVSWKSIARAKLKDPQSRPRDAFVRTQTTRLSDDVIRIVPLVLDLDFVLVEDHGILQGIVTPYDLTEFFGERITPFMLIGEIDKRLRRAIDMLFSLSEIQAVCGRGRRVIDSVDDLSIGDYIAILQSHDHWNRLGWPLDRALVLESLNEVREMRNRLMHFKERAVVDVTAIRNVLSVIRDFMPTRPYIPDTSTSA